MAILSRVKISPQQRYDLEDFYAQQAATRTDAKLFVQKMFSDLNLVLAGFSVSGLGLTSATIGMSNAALIVPQNTFDFSYFISAPAEPDVVISDADLVDGVRNYIEATLTTQDGTPLTKALWDPEANSGLGAEFNQVVNTITDLQISFVTSTGGFSGDPDRVPIAIVDTNGSGTIKVILDRRSMFGRLSVPSDIDQGYTWGTQIEPVYSLVMTGTAGTFQADEEISIGGETATVVTGGTTSITFNVPSGINFANGDSVVGATSGATGTVNTISESFSGADKNLVNQKKINDALMTEIKAIKGTRFWYEVASASLAGVSSFVNSLITQSSSGAKVSWDGANLALSDASGAPADADVVAHIRLFGRNQVLSLTREDGTGGSSEIALADGEVLFVEIPTSGNRVYSGSGSGSTNFQVVDFESFSEADKNYWLAFRDGAKVYFRGIGELESGETSEIGDSVPSTLLDIIGIADEVTSPAYSSDIRGVAAESLVARLGTLTDAVGDSQEDRSAFIRSDDEVLWDGTQLNFTADIVLEIINTKSGITTEHSIDFADSPLTIDDGESIWVSIDRNDVSEVITAVRSSITPIPAQVQADKDVFVLFKRIDAGGVKYLHLPFHKQMVLEGASFRLGQAGSGGTGIFKATLHDAISSTLPSGPTVSIDGIAGVDDDLVLFTNLGVDNNQIYKLGGVGVSITWTAQRAFNGSFTPEDGDFVVVQNGTAFGNQLGQFVDSTFKFNDTVRFFSGIDYWEMSSLKSTTLTDNTTGNVFSVTAVGSENMVVDFSILRNGIKETGSLFITSDGVNASVTVASAYLGITDVSFVADISAGNLRLRYTTASTGFDATMRYFTRRWSDTVGGPSSIISYTPFVATVNNAAFCMSDASGIALNCSNPTVVLGKTQVALSFTYLVAANSGLTVGDLEIYVNGQRYPRFVAGTTLDGYYTEVNNTTIEFNTDLSGSPLSIEIVKRV